MATNFNDKKCPIEKCRAKGGPLNCRYHSGVVNDCMKGIIKLGVDERNVGSRDINDTSEYAQQVSVLDDTVDKLLRIYTYNDCYERSKRDKHAAEGAFTSITGKKLTDEDISDIRVSLYHIKDAIRDGNSGGRTLATCVAEFNALIDVPASRLLEETENIDFENDTVKGKISQNDYLSKNIPQLSKQIFFDGSFNLDNVLSKEMQEDTIQWFENKMNKQLRINDEYLWTYHGFLDDLDSLYPPTNDANNDNLDSLKNRMSKADVETFWDYALKKYPLLKQEYPLTDKLDLISDLENITNDIKRKASKLGEWSINLTTFYHAFNYQDNSHSLAPVAVLLAAKARQEENIKNALSDIKPFIPKEYLSLAPEPPSYSKKEDELIQKVFIGLLHPDKMGEVKYFTHAQLAKNKIRDLNLNWDSHIITSTIRLNDKTLQDAYDLDLSKTKRTFKNDNSFQYEIPINSSNEGEVPKTVIISFDNNNKHNPNSSPKITIRYGTKR